MADTTKLQESSKTKLLIIGGVAAGATAAARARRINEHAEITVIERGPYVSYANCGLPYFISRDIDKRSHLLLQTPEGFEARYGVQVLVNTEAVAIDRAAKLVRVRTPEGERDLPYDKLILAQGGNPIMPTLPGVDREQVFSLWTVPDMDRLHRYIDERKPKSAVVVGGGFIGVEMAEAFVKRGLRTTVVELLPTILAAMDREVGLAATAQLRAHGVTVITGVGVSKVHAEQVELSDGRHVDAEVVLFSVGVRPQLSLAQAAGLTVGISGGLAVDENLLTSDADIYGAGDMVEVLHRVSAREVRIPLAGPANRQGRIAAANALGMPMRYRGALGTSVVKVLDATLAATGLGEQAARKAGFDVGVAIIHKDHHAGYYPNAKELMLKLIYDRKTTKLLGAQAFGEAGVDKRIDVLATALAAEMTLADLSELDLAYAPPYSSANDPINVAAFVAQNDISGFSPIITAAELGRELASSAPPLLIDVRTLGEYSCGHLKGALNIPVDELRFELEALPRNRRIIVYCRSGYRGHLALRVLRANGINDVANVTGGYLSVALDGACELESA